MVEYRRCGITISGDKPLQGLFAFWVVGWNDASTLITSKGYAKTKALYYVLNTND
jgi:hypothetical protein